MGRDQATPITARAVADMTPGQWRQLSGKSRWYGDGNEVPQRVDVLSKLDRADQRLVRIVLARSFAKPYRKAKSKDGAAHSAEVGALRITRRSGKTAVALMTSNLEDGILLDAFNKAQRGLHGTIAMDDPPVAVTLVHNHPFPGPLSSGDIGLARELKESYRAAGLDIPVSTISAFQVKQTIVVHRYTVD